MPRYELYCQCRMTRGNRSTTGFIPARAAGVGRTVELEVAGVMEPGWRIESVGEPVAKDAMRLLERQHRSQRAGSDV